MLNSLHVKNLALVVDSQVEFKSGLNILTGETGAGKSVLMEAINLALGGRFTKEMLRHGEESAYVELIFTNLDEKVYKKFEELELDKPEDDKVIISRRMSEDRSVFKLNGEAVNTRIIKEIAYTLIDIHGQNEHQSLLKRSRHLEILDEYCVPRINERKEKVAKLYARYEKISEELTKEIRDETELKREKDLAEYELQEIEAELFKEGEDTELEDKYQLMLNSGKIGDAIKEAYAITSQGGAGSIQDSLSKAVKSLKGVEDVTEKLGSLAAQITEIESLFNDFNNDLSKVVTDYDFDEGSLNEIANKLDNINRLKSKYGNSYQAIRDYAEEKREQLDKISDYDSYVTSLSKEKEELHYKLSEEARILSDIRKSEASNLTGLLTESLYGLNFDYADVELKFTEKEEMTKDGYDDVEFMVSLNKGEPLMPLAAVASGGELSRIMLAIKTVLAKKDSIDSLLFDEIDAGISGVTAWKVSKEIGKVAKDHQVICITHLPQIAAMADTHFVITKETDGDVTKTDIQRCTEDMTIAEMARLLGSDEVSFSAMENARQMRISAKGFKDSM